MLTANISRQAPVHAYGALPEPLQKLALNGLGELGSRKGLPFAYELSAVDLGSRA
jgi:hypothetical protein